MSDDVYWIYVVSVNENVFESFKKLAVELVSASMKEAGTIAYQFSAGADGKTVHIFEHYKNSEAVVSHVHHTFGRFAESFKSMAKTTNVTVYGTPDEAARELIDQWGAVYMTPFDGFLDRR